MTLKGENFVRGERGERRENCEILFRTVISFWDVQKIRMFIIKIMRRESKRTVPIKVLMGFVKWEGLSLYEILSQRTQINCSLVLKGY